MVKAPKIINMMQDSTGRFIDSGEELDDARGHQTPEEAIEQLRAAVAREDSSGRFDDLTEEDRPSPEDTIEKLIIESIRKEEGGPKGYIEGGLSAVPLGVGFILPFAATAIPNYGIILSAGPSVSQLWLAWTGAAVGVATVLTASTLGKSALGFSRKDSFLASGSSMATAGLMAFALTNGWMAPPVAEPQGYVDTNRFDWSEASPEILKTHWCVVDMEGHQKPDWDGKNLDCGPYPENPPDFPAPVPEPVTP